MNKIAQINENEYGPNVLNVPENFTLFLSSKKHNRLDTCWVYAYICFTLSSQMHTDMRHWLFPSVTTTKANVHNAPDKKFMHSSLSDDF